MNALFSGLCFPFLEFQVGRFAFDGTNYYIFIFDTVYSPKLFQHFLKGRFVCILQPKPRNRTFVIESVGVYRDNVKIFQNFIKTLIPFEHQLFSYKTAKFQISGTKSCPSWNVECLIVLS